MVAGRMFRPGRLIVGFGVAALLLWAGMLLSAAPAAAAGSISGTVTDANTEAPIEEVEVCAWGEGSFDCELTDESGEYTLPDLQADEYLVEFWAPWLGYLTQYYNGKSSWEEADPVTVADEPVTGIDAALTEGGRIQGTVTDAASNAPIEEVEVCAYSEGSGFGCAFTGSGGDYTIPALAADEYLVEFWAPWLGYPTQFFNGKANPSEADLVSVSLGDTVTGVDAKLAKPAPPPPIVTPPPPPQPAVTPPVTQAKPKPRRCRKGFRRKRVRKKVRCVKVKKRRGRRHKNG